MPIKIYVISLIIVVSQIHYQNRNAKRPSNPQGGGAKNFWYAQESLGVRSTRGSVRLPIGVFDSLLSITVVHCAPCPINRVQEVLNCIDE